MTEHQHQVALFRWAELASGAQPDLDLMHAVPNGARTSISVARKLKAEGLKAGVPDICLPVPRNGWHGLYVELKTEKGRASSKQRRWIEQLRKQGYRAEVCKGWHAAKELIEEYLG